MKGKFGKLDVIIICILIAAVAVGGAFYFRKREAASTGRMRLIEFDILALDLSQEQAESMKNMEGTKVIFGKTNIDTGLLKRVEIEPYRPLEKNILEGKFIFAEHPTHFQVTLTIEKEVVETEDAFIGEKEEIRIGELTPVKGKGFGAADCYITDIREAAK